HEIGIAEIVAAVPERYVLAHHRAHVEDRLERDAGDAKRQHRRGMMMADCVNVRPRLIDAAGNDALAVHLDLGRHYRLRIEGEFEQVGRFDQFRAARARQNIAAWIVRMTNADMAETV